MEIVHVDDAGALDAARVALLAGQVIVVPTDTVYGLAALPHDASAVQLIYQAKDRPDGVHLPILAASSDQVLALGVEMNTAAAILAARWWPGPLTMAFGFSKSARRPTWLDGRDEVAVRVPRNDFLLALMERTGVLAVTSANRHGAPTPVSADEAARHLAVEVSLIVDGGTLDSVPSTLVNVHQPTPVIEREGAIHGASIAHALERTG